MATVISLMLLSAPGTACPAYIDASALPEFTHAWTRRSLRVLALTEVAGTRTWQALALQVEPLDDKGVLLGGGSEAGVDLGSMTLPLGATDRLALRREGFGARAAASDALPCGAGAAIELASPEPEHRYAYLTSCPEDTVLDQPLNSPQSTNPVVHDAANFHVDAPRFDYYYQPSNQLMYRRLNVKAPTGDKKGTTLPVLAASDADLHLHLDIKKFFTMDLRRGDVESYVQSTQVGPVGVVASIEFYLRLLFFKVNLKMATTVGFYADSAHVPAIVDVPIDAASMLHPGSGMLYTWRFGAAAVDQSHPEQTLPNADTLRIAKGYKELAAIGERYCQGTVCRFRLRGAIGQEAYGLDISVARQVVRQGFFPQWVGDVASFKQALDWDEDESGEKNLVGVYFDNSGLEKGQYKLDQWIRIGKGDNLSLACPRPVVIGATRSFASRPPFSGHP